MATTALHSAATGLNALSTQIDVSANNLANANTVGFRRSRVNFEDLIYQELHRPGTTNAQGIKTPAGTYVGLGVRVSNTQAMFEQGNLDQTGRELDMAIQGNGFFQVKIFDDFGTGVGYTRSGNFFVNSDGNLVLGNAEGFALEPPISIPSDHTKIDIGSDGRVFVTTPSSITPEEVGQIQLARFINPAGLQQIGGSMFVESEASGPPTLANPGSEGLGITIQEFLESSNVDPVKELVELIKAQRAFELNSQSIQTADETLQVIGNLRRY
ncbi:MAG: Flagellar basal-body rod protein FlgG [Phycisphaerae bacterium]|nr:Flagellar basal-body rod protein FlgG [Phycisphaerae bacterium]